MDEFPYDDFLDTDEPPGDQNPEGDKTPDGPNLADIRDLKPRDLTRSIMSVYYQLGGDAWLLTQARLNPKEFLGMLKAIMPKNVDVSLEHEIVVQIAAPFMDKPQIESFMGNPRDALKVIGNKSTGTKEI